MTFFAYCVHVCKLWTTLSSSQLIILLIVARVLGVTLVRGPRLETALHKNGTKVDAGNVSRNVRYGLYDVRRNSEHFYTEHNYLE